jgi:hypothetical protein
MILSVDDIFLDNSDAMSEIDNRKRLLNIYENEITSAQKWCEITNIPRSTVYDNLKKFRKGKSEIRCPGSCRKKIFDVNEQQAGYRTSSFSSAMVSTANCQ